jgi:hypothetical protein
VKAEDDGLAPEAKARAPDAEGVEVVVERLVEVAQHELRLGGGQPLPQEPGREAGGEGSIRARAASR